jgi:hypothetical protein
MDILDSTATASVFYSIGSNFREFYSTLEKLDGKSEEERKKKAEEMIIQQYGSNDDNKVIAKRIGKDVSTVNKHLKRLLEANLIQPSDDTIEAYSEHIKKSKLTPHKFFSQRGVNPVRKMGRLPGRVFEINKEGLLELLLESVSQNWPWRLEKVYYPDSGPLQTAYLGGTPHEGIEVYRNIIKRYGTEIFAEDKGQSKLWIGWKNRIKNPIQPEKAKLKDFLALYLRKYTLDLNPEYPENCYTIREFVLSFMCVMKDLWVDATRSDNQMKITTDITGDREPSRTHYAITDTADKGLVKMLKDETFCYFFFGLDAVLSREQVAWIRIRILRGNSQDDIEYLSKTLEDVFGFGYRKEVHTKIFLETRNEYYERVAPVDKMINSPSGEDSFVSEDVRKKNFKYYRMVHPDREKLDAERKRILGEIERRQTEVL